MTYTSIKVSKSNIKENKLFYIEGVRGTAAIMVVIYHYLLAFYPAFANGKLNETHLLSFEIMYYKSPFLFLTNGQFFVYIFFVLSGYVLSYQSIINQDKTYLLSALIRRFPRLYIPVFFSVLFAFILLKFSLYYGHEVSIITKSSWLNSLGTTPSIHSFLKSLLLTSFFLGDSKYNTVLWSISIELYGSMLVFATVSLTKNNTNSIIITLSLLLLLIINDKFEYCAFVFGILLNFCNFSKTSSKLKKIYNAFFLLAGLALGSFPHIYYLSTPTIKGTFFDFLDYNYLIKSSNLINGIGSFFVILSVKNSSFLRDIFSKKILNFAGYISFSMYLIHALILQSFSSYLFLIMIKFFDYNVSFLIQFIFTIFIVVLCSYIMTIFVDKKSVLFSKYFYEYFFNRKNKVTEYYKSKH